MENTMVGKLHFAPLHFTQNLTLVLTQQYVTLNPLHFWSSVTLALLLTGRLTEVTL